MWWAQSPLVSFENMRNIQEDPNNYFRPRVCSRPILCIYVLRNLPDIVPPHDYFWGYQSFGKDFGFFWISSLITGWVLSLVVLLHVSQNIRIWNICHKQVSWRCWRLGIQFLTEIPDISGEKIEMAICFHFGTLNFQTHTLPNEFSWILIASIIGLGLGSGPCTWLWLRL